MIWYELPENMDLHKDCDYKIIQNWWTQYEKKLISFILSTPYNFKPMVGIFRKFALIWTLP